ncbi:MAG: PHP domain-containing protein, partial [Firmicutes bacterium]|nr:PHP domain-containing protein [Bacillota bacterium]
MSNGKRTLCDVLSKYNPDSRARDILLSATDYKVKVDKDARMIVINASFPRYIKRTELSRIEREVASEDVYSLSLMRIFPSYPKELFSLNYLPEIFDDVVADGYVARGFFDDYTASLSADGAILKIAIPFRQGGIEMLRTSETEIAVEKALEREFLVKVKVSISQRGDYRDIEAAREIEKNKMISEYIQNGNRARAEAQRELDAQEAAISDAYSVPLEGGDDTAHFDREEKVLSVGTLRLDVSSPEPILGGDIHPENASPLSALNHEMTRITVAGEIFEVTSKESKDFQKLSINIGITDNMLSTYVKLRKPKEEGDKLMKLFKVGSVVLVEGRVRAEDMTERRRNYNRGDASAETQSKPIDTPPSPLPNIEYSITPFAISKVEKLIRPDTAPKKRVELHLHTSMSQMDAMASAEAVLRRAQYWGHPAIAITDHGNAQAFPDAMLESEKSGMKVIYGMEAYFVDDEARAVYGQCNSEFDDEFVVFDIETTGLSISNDSIIEIGAVILRNGELCETFSYYCNPGFHIPEKITELTGISDETVADADTIENVLPLFLEFCGDRPLIAHNAAFDTGFIRNASARQHLKFDNAYIDTLAMSRYVNTELTRHTLDAVA